MQLTVHQKANRKRPAGGWRRRLLQAAVVLSVCLAVAGLYLAGEHLRRAFQVARAFVLDSSYFAVREIQVRSGDRVGGSELVRVAGLKHGMNIWSVNPTTIESRIARHPWVRRVLVRRDFPRRIVIEVEERTPKAIIAMGRLYYVDGDGTVFKEVDRRDKLGLPMITGIHPEQIASGGPTLRRRLKEAIKLGDLMATETHRLSEIHFTAPERVVVYTTSYPAALHFGWGDWDDKVQRIKRVLALWKGHEQRLGSLDVSFRGQAVARIRQLR